MSSVADAARAWRDAQEEARITGTRAAHARVEQTRQQVAAAHRAAQEARRAERKSGRR